MRSFIASFILCFTISCLAHWPADDSASFTEGEKLKQISDAFWQQTLQDSPVWATFIGNRQFDENLPDLSPLVIQKETDAYQSLLARLQKLDQSQLAREEQITSDVLFQELKSTVECTQCKNWLWVVDQLDGPQVNFAELPNHHTILSLRDAQNLIKRYQKMKGFYEQHIANLKAGMLQGYLSAKINVELVIKQLNRQINETPEKSPYYEISHHLPSKLSNEQKEQIKADLLLSIKNHVYPGLLAYRNFLQKDLLVNARDDVSVSSIPQGQACYTALIRKYTGLKLSAEEIHQLGLREVTRIKTEMNKLIHASNPNLDLPLYKKMLLQKNKEHPPSRKDLLVYNQRLVTKAQTVLPRAFTQIPKTPIEVKSIEAFREQEAPAAYYYEAPSDNSRPAFYYLNTYEPENRSLYSMPVLAFHEAIPGHHLQIALANENKSLPEFQRQLGQTAFVEGWALYAEGLADELGLYENMDEKMGALNYELWRALRLVIDTGIHYKKWPRQKALQYLAEQTSLPETEVVNEIDRYIVWPGQALAYKIGQLEIMQVRREAELKLGRKFSLTAFHDRLLQFGALPLPTMRRNMENWVQEQESSNDDRGVMHRP